MGWVAGSVGMYLLRTTNCYSDYVIQQWVSTELLPLQDVSVPLAHNQLWNIICHLRKSSVQRLFENTRGVKKLLQIIGSLVSFGWTIPSQWCADILLCSHGWIWLPCDWNAARHTRWHGWAIRPRYQQYPWWIDAPQPQSCRWKIQPNSWGWLACWTAVCCFSSNLSTH